MLEQMASMNGGWTRLRFDEIAVNVTERVQPGPDENETYVGLEHLDSGSLRVRRWGSEVALKGTKLRMREGDILFAKRNAYLRRVALAPHDGLFSAHGMVLRAKPEAILPEFLPFFMQSDPFMERALSISVGSLSPTINWKTLAKEEFLLPSIQEQARLVEALEATVRVGDALFDLEQQLQQLLSSTLKELFQREERKERLVLDDVLDRVIDYRGKPPPKSSDGIPLITAKNIRNGYINQEPREFIPEAKFDSWMRRGLPEAGDVLFTTEAPLGNVARVPSYKFALGQRSITLRAEARRISPDYLYWLMRSPTTRREIFARATGTTAVGIKQSLLREIPIFIPEMDEQLKASSALNKIESRLTNAIARRADFSAMQRRLVNEAVA